MKNTILYAIQDISYSNKAIEIPTISEYPEPIDVLAIHKALYKEMQNALETLFKSMMFNSQRLKEAVDKGYEVRRMEG